MGRSGGTGSPNWFRCSRKRRGDYHDPDWRVTLTGRFREYRSARYSVMGSRSLHVAFEYRCPCGHVGWSNHIDVGRMAGINRQELPFADDQLNAAQEWSAKLYAKEGGA